MPSGPSSVATPRFPSQSSWSARFTKCSSRSLRTSRSFWTGWCAGAVAHYRSLGLLFLPGFFCHVPHARAPAWLFLLRPQNTTISMWTLVQSQTNTRTRRQVEATASGRKEKWVEPGSPDEGGSVRFKAIARIAMLGGGGDTGRGLRGGGLDGGRLGLPPISRPVDARRRMSLGAAMTTAPVSPSSPSPGTMMSAVQRASSVDPGFGPTAGVGASGRVVLSRSPSERSPSSRDAMLRDWGSPFQRGRQSMTRQASRASDGRSSVSSIGEGSQYGSAGGAGGGAGPALATRTLSGFAQQSPPGRASLPAHASSSRGMLTITIDDEGPPMEEDEDNHREEEEEQEEIARAVSAASGGGVPLGPIAEGSSGPAGLHPG